MASSIVALRQRIEQRFPDAVPVSYRSVPAGVATGVDALDEALPGGGFPRGRLSVWRSGGGATALVRAACRAVVDRGGRAAWVDGAGTLTRPIEADDSILVRPSDRRGALECAEELLRSAGFALVVLTGVRSLEAGVRLSRIAREGGSALVVLGAEAPVAALRLTSEIRSGGYAWRAGPFGEPAAVEGATVRVRATALGWSAEAEVPLRIVTRELRLSSDPRRIDRRGVRR